MQHQYINLWDDEVGSTINKDKCHQMLETFILSDDKVRKAVLICPGGGYVINTRREAYPVALRFNAYGYHAFILHYSIAPNRHPMPIMDCSQAMNIIRQNTSKWNIDPHKIAICGFSAGAHLAASLGVHWNKPYLNTPGMIAGINRPDAMILSYPVITMKELGDKGSTTNLIGNNPNAALVEEMSLESQVSEKTPPAFIWHTVDDDLVPVDNSMLFASALRKNNIPFEMHLFNKGPHGLSMADVESIAEDMKPNLHVAHWFDLCLEWLDDVMR